MRKKCTAIPLILILIIALSFTTSLSCYAFGGDFPEKTMIITEQEMVEWYQSDMEEGFLGVEIGLSGMVHLNAPMGKKS